jgi:hypothetical protein
MRWLLHHTADETKHAMEVAEQRGGKAGLLPTQMNSQKKAKWPYMRLLTDERFGGKFAACVEQTLVAQRDKLETQQAADESDKAWQQAQLRLTDPREYLGASVGEGKKEARPDQWKKLHRRKTLANRNRRVSSPERGQFFDIYPMPVAVGPAIEQPPKLPPSVKMPLSPGSQNAIPPSTAPA